MRPNTQRRLRQLHRYLGVFFAPAILFFALSGMLQTVRLNDGTPAAPAPGWIAWMAGIHKDQAPPRPRKPRPAPAALEAQGADAAAAAAEGAGAAEAKHGADTPAFAPLKLFVMLMSLGLILSTLLGLAIALTTRATRMPSLVALAAGVAVPLLLMLG